ncbi:MAG: recombinase family protein [Oscillospiraceae bacterium]
MRLYADEGISGTKIKNRKEFLRMMADAERGLLTWWWSRISPALPETPWTCCKISAS